jgi:hypothetical protein
MRNLRVFVFTLVWAALVVLVVHSWLSILAQKVPE